MSDLSDEYNGSPASVVSPLFRSCPDGIELFVRLTPKSSVNSVDGTETRADGRSYLKARVRAVPEKGAANAGLEDLIAKTLSVPKTSVSVVKGTTARLKTVRVNGDCAILIELLEKAMTAIGARNLPFSSEYQ